MQWQPTAAYYTFTITQKGDRYTAADCEASTTGAAPSFCTTSATTLTDFMTAGFHSRSDGVTYHLTDGQIITAEGIPVWVASNARTLASVGALTLEYRTYFQLNGHIYTGSLIKDGTTIGGAPYATATGTAYPAFQMRFDAAAIDSLAAGLKF